MSISSLEIARITGTKHSAVMRNIRLQSLGVGFNVPIVDNVKDGKKDTEAGIIKSSYVADNGRTYVMYVINILHAIQLDCCNSHVIMDKIYDQIIKNKEDESKGTKEVE